MMTSHQDNGFTLLEVLVSISILLLLFVILYGTFDATYKAAERVEAEAKGFRLARSAFYHLMRDTSMAYQDKAPVGQPEARASFEGMDGIRRIEGADFPHDAIRFATLSHRATTQDAPESDRSDVRYYLQDERLIREETLSTGRTIQDELGEGVRGLNFRYMDKDAEWVDKWDAAEAPSHLEAELIFEPGGGAAHRLSTRMEIRPASGRPG